jgi:hypothetical protein
MCSSFALWSLLLVLFWMLLVCSGKTWGRSGSRTFAGRMH